MLITKLRGRDLAHRVLGSCKKDIYTQRTVMWGLKVIKEEPCTLGGSE